jgi:uncharacterized protein (TIGR02147 family)
MKLEEMQQKNPRLSLRALARKLGISPGCLTELMQGKRPLSEFYASKVVLGLEMGPEERNQVFSLITTRSRKFDAQKVIAEKELELLKSWEHFAVLNLIRTKDFQPEPAWIAERLSISPEKAEESLELLLTLGFVKRKGNSLARSVGSLTTTHDIPSQELVNAHIGDLKKAISVLQETPPKVRDYSSITMAINPEQIDEAKKLIKDFRKKLAMLVERGDKTEVYNLNIQFFPLTAITQEHSHEV